MTAVRYAMLSTVAARAFASMPPIDYMPTTPAAVEQARQGFTADNLTGDFMLVRAPDIACMVDYWDKTDAIVDGIDAMRGAGEKYLPKFYEEDGIAYNFRKKMTKLTNIYRDTVEALASKPFEQDVDFGDDDDNDVPQQIDDFSEDVDGSGNNLTIFAGSVFFNGINSAIDWIFVDHPPVNANVVSIADAKALGARPYWSRVLGRNVYVATSKVINGNETLVFMRILEPQKPQDQMREFTRNPDGSITWTLYQKNPNEWRDVAGQGRTQFFAIDEGTLTIDQIPLVPFITGRRDGRTFKIFPAMQDAADLQIELYQQESGLKFVKTMAAYPMLAGNGVRPVMEADTKTPKKLAIGPGQVLYAPPDNNGNVGSWVFVEPAATSLTFLASDIEKTKQDLRELGRQPLTAQSGNLTVITTAVAAGKAKSAVKAWAFILKDAIENAMTITCKYLHIDAATYDPVVNVYTEFDEFLDGKDLDALGMARFPTAPGATPAISAETYRQELRRRDVLSSDVSEEVEKKRLLDEMPGDGEDNDPGTLDPLDPTLPTPKPGDPPLPMPKPTNPPKPKGAAQ